MCVCECVCVCVCARARVCHLIHRGAQLMFLAEGMQLVLQVENLLRLLGKQLLILCELLLVLLDLVEEIVP